MSNYVLFLGVALKQEFCETLRGFDDKKIIEKYLCAFLLSEPKMATTVYTNA
jgi:hypothetical protein